MAAPVTLRTERQGRLLPKRLIGMNSPLTFALPGDDPATLQPARELGPTYLRFPGGTVSNFYDWRSGHLEVPTFAGESYLRAIMRTIADVIRARHPEPYSLQAFVKEAREIGAETIVVPNLETSTPELQGTWLERARRDGLRPALVEMGNEFFFGLMGDPESERRFPNCESTLALTRTFVEAIRPHLDDGARIAVQSASSRFYVDREPQSGTLARCWRWDQDIRGADWFDAVTAHFYPEFDCFAGPGTSARIPEEIDRLYDALLARADSGIARALDFLEERLPGKEIWITEWSAWPLSIGAWLQEKPLPELPPHPSFAPFQAIWLPYIGRMLLSMLRRSAVTVILYHALSFSGGVWGLFDRQAGGDYIPIGPCELLRWFIEAVHGAEYHELTSEGTRRIDGGTPISGETYSEIEGALFSRRTERTLIVQNAARSGRTVDISAVLDQHEPGSVEILLTPDFLSVLDHKLPQVATGKIASGMLDLPGPSLARIRWEA